MEKAHCGQVLFASCIWLTIIHGSSKSPRHLICQTIDLAVTRAQDCLGTGTTISFWEDPWFSCGVLSKVFPCLLRDVVRLVEIRVSWSNP